MSALDGVTNLNNNAPSSVIVSYSDDKKIKQHKRRSIVWTLLYTIFGFIAFVWLFSFFFYPSLFTSMFRRKKHNRKDEDDVVEDQCGVDLSAAHFDYFYSDNCSPCKHFNPRTKKYEGMSVWISKYLSNCKDDNFPMVLHNWSKPEERNHHKFAGVTSLPTLRFTCIAKHVISYDGPSTYADVAKWINKCMTYSQS